MERKPKPDTYIEPMPKSQFLSLMQEFKSLGGKYICNEESEKFLDVQGSEAVTLNGYTILFRKKPSRSAVYEELFHAAQYRDGKNDGTPKIRIECEIEAQEYLLNNAKSLQLTKPEIIQTQKALQIYRLELDKMEGGTV
jgi:hypothetical protein